jgi:hypothetical protein
MKTLIHIETKSSKFIFPDNAHIVLAEDRILCPDLIIGDMNANNSMLVENVIPPDDWRGSKYLYDNGTWTLDPEWKN